jgi:hypothetical protein
MAMRFMVTGSRQWTDRVKIRRILSEIYFMFNGSENELILVNGMADGADKICREEGFALGFVIEDHPPNLKLYGSPHAYWVRNREMAQSGVYWCLAFPQGVLRGTRGTMDICRTLNIPVFDCSQLDTLVK